VFLFSVFWFLLSVWAISHTAHYPVPPRPDRGYDYRGVLRRPPVIAALTVLTFGFIAVLTGQTLSAQFLEEARGFSRSAIGAFGSLNALGTAVFSIALARLPAWRGFFATLLLVLVAFGLLLAGGAWPVVVAAYFLLGAYYTTRPFAVSVISHYVQEHQRGMAYALVDTLAGLATVLGTNLAGVLYAQDTAWPFQAGIGGLIAVVVAGFVLLRSPAHRHPDTVPAQPGVESG